MRASVHGGTEMWSAERGVQTFHDFSAPLALASGGQGARGKGHGI
jgi:hypothetical protein